MSRAILILAAGASSRMGVGRDKLMEQIGGTALLRLNCDKALSCGLQVFACVPSKTHDRAALLPEGVRAIPVPNAAEGMGVSLATGIAALPDHISDVMILPADMPDLSAVDLAQVWGEHQSDQITRGASSAAKPGHPVIFPRECFAGLRQLTGDEGARSVVKSYAGQVQLVPLPGQNALTDLDTPEAWADWRAKAGGR
ncbi:nucleotidyltransferase family protein [Thalassovita sp.]|uniref:nucleotidyltransferase family protein n=1 Tax=Thalassovita sp. TaxID=1979401 RepID=UPI002AB0DBC6|nr:nucleotidyltransferase family protein [Thalassovita sp.]